MDKINQNWSFEVVAIPQENLTNIPVNNTTPMKVKIRVKKGENTTDTWPGIISVPKFKNQKYAEKIRVVHSDQTIMSFDMLTETNQILKPRHKSQNKFFHIFKKGKCLGNKSEDVKDPPYMVSCPGNSEALLKSTEDEKRNIILLGNSPGIKTSKEVTKYPVYFLGKCKPGGCLDPPFGEDKYQYRPPIKPKLSFFDEKEKYKDSSREKLNENNNQNSEAIVHSISLLTNDCNETNTSSTLTLYKAKSEKVSLEEKYSDSIITYPPEPLSPVLDKTVTSRKTSIVKNRLSNNVTDAYFIPKKINTGLERNKDKKSIDINNREKTISKESPPPNVKQILLKATAVSRKSYPPSETSEEVIQPEINSLFQKSESKDSRSSFRTIIDKDQELECSKIDQNEIYKLLTSKENILDGDAATRDSLVPISSSIYQRHSKSGQNADIQSLSKYSKSFVSTDTSFQTLGNNTYNVVKNICSYDITDNVLQPSVDNSDLKHDENSQNLKPVNIEQISRIEIKHKHDKKSLQLKEIVEKDNEIKKVISRVSLDHNEVQLADLHSFVLNETEKTNLNPRELSPSVISRNNEVNKSDKKFTLDFVHDEIKSSETDNSMNPREEITQKKSLTDDRIDLPFKNGNQLTHNKLKTIINTNDFNMTTPEDIITNLNINQLKAKDSKSNLKYYTEKDTSSSNLSLENYISSHLDNVPSKDKNVSSMNSPEVKSLKEKDLNESFETVSIETYIKSIIRSEIIAKHGKCTNTDLQSSGNIYSDLEHFNKETTSSDSLPLNDTHSLSKVKNKSIDPLTIKNEMIDSDLHEDGENILSATYQYDDDFVKVPQNLESQSSKLTLNFDTHAKNLSSTTYEYKPSTVNIIKSYLRTSLPTVDQTIEKPKDFSTTNTEIQKSEKESLLTTKINNYNQITENMVAINLDWKSSEGKNELNFLSIGNNSSSKTMIVDLAFQTYTNERNETVLKTFEALKEPQRFPNDKVSVITSKLNINDKKMMLAINSKTRLFIEINNDDNWTFKDKAKEYRYDLENKNDLSTTSVKILQESLAALYDNDLVPVEKLIKGLIEDVDKLSKYRVVLKKSTVIKKPKALKPTYSYKCRCLKK